MLERLAMSSKLETIPKNAKKQQECDQCPTPRSRFWSEPVIYAPFTQDGRRRPDREDGERRKSYKYPSRSAVILP